MSVGYSGQTKEPCAPHGPHIQYVSIWYTGKSVKIEELTVGKTSCKSVFYLCTAAAESHLCHSNNSVVVLRCGNRCSLDFIYFLVGLVAFHLSVCVSEQKHLSRKYLHHICTVRAAELKVSVRAVVTCCERKPTVLPCSCLGHSGGGGGGGGV